MRRRRASLRRYDGESWSIFAALSEPFDHHPAVTRTPPRRERGLKTRRALNRIGMHVRKHFSGTTALGVFLAGTLVMAGWLGFQAFDAAVSHRRTAESVLSDYARISATEMARLSNQRMDDVLDEVFAPVSEFRLRRRGVVSAAVLREQMAEAVDDERCDCPAFRAPVALFRFPVDSGTIEVVPDDVAPGLISAVHAHVREVPASGREEHGLLTLTASEAAGEPLAVGYTVPENDDPEDRVPIYGFVVRYRALAELFEEWYGEETLLPQPIAGEQPNDSLLHVTVSDPAGNIVFASPVGFPTRLSATAPMAGAYGGLLVSAAVRPDAASQLVIGGLPRARLPLITALLLLTLGVGIAAAVQLRRERIFQRLRDDFVSGVSHELRTPLAQIRMFAELQQDGKLVSPKDASRANFVIHREAIRLSHLVENILQFSRLRRPVEQPLPTERVDLADALRDGLDAIEPLVRDRGMRLQLDAQSDLRVEVNREALTRILINLLDNAVKYGPAGQTVKVRVEGAPGVARLSVTDEGPGVPPAERRRIWNPYFRLERDMRRNVSGTGIGLSVVADLVALHGGRVWVGSAEPSGAAFVVELPLAPIHASRPEPVAAA